jgi:hypothetical protein
MGIGRRPPTPCRDEATVARSRSLSEAAPASRAPGQTAGGGSRNLACGGNPVRRQNKVEAPPVVGSSGRGADGVVDQGGSSASMDDGDGRWRKRFFGTGTQGGALGGPSAKVSGEAHWVLVVVGSTGGARRWQTLPARGGARRWKTLPARGGAGWG